MQCNAMRSKVKEHKTELNKTKIKGIKAKRKETTSCRKRGSSPAMRVVRNPGNQTKRTNLFIDFDFSSAVCYRNGVPWTVVLTFGQCSKLSAQHRGTRRISCVFLICRHTEYKESIEPSRDAAKRTEHPVRRDSFPGERSNRPILKRFHGMHCFIFQLCILLIILP